MIDSIWSKKVPPRYPPLAGDIQAEAAVIGGGMAGVLTARLLQEAGVDTVLLEAERIGGGQTSGTTAKVTAQHGDKYRQLLASLGAEAAGQYAAAQRQAVEDYEALIRRAGIRCGWERRSSWLTAGEEAPLREELEACRTLGLPVKFLPDPQLPFPAAGAVELPEQGQFHPLEFLYGAAQGLRIYEKSRVLQAEENLLHTRQGSVSCRYVVFADHYPFPKTPGYYFLRLHQERSYILALEGAKIPPAMVYHLEPAGKVLSLRPWGEGLLLGGEGHLTGEGREGGRYAALEQRAKELFPGCRVVKRWSAQDCIPLDGLPYIGAFSPARPGWFVATGFGKWGMTGSMVAARMLRERRFLPPAVPPFRLRPDPGGKQPPGGQGPGAAVSHPAQGHCGAPSQGTWRHCGGGGGKAGGLSGRGGGGLSGGGPLPPPGLPAGMESGREKLGLPLPRLPVRLPGETPNRPRPRGAAHPAQRGLDVLLSG